jgi:hypothetical protein
MKIGIITFHWATNYGAVLQSFALQTYLKNLGFDTQIINYIPFTGKKSFIKCFRTKRPWIIFSNILDFIKEKKIDGFRKKNLVTSRKYSSYEDLKSSPPRYDVYICGSDQIWNPNFTKTGEGKLTKSYFLDFGSNETKRLAYAVSFGCKKYPEEILDSVKPCISKMYAISVREKSGVEIMLQAGIEHVSLMPDPTLLLTAKYYKKIAENDLLKTDNACFFYTLHTEQDFLIKLKKTLAKQLGYQIIDTRSPTHSTIGIETWLGMIQSSKFVVTNSYHGMIFAILFHKPFIAVLVKGHKVGMNDRILTLLDNIGLSDRILDGFDKKKIDKIIERKIDWPTVENRIETLRDSAHKFFKKNLHKNFEDNT